MSKWQIKLKGSAAKSLKSLDTSTKQRVERFINQLTETDNPRLHGKALQEKNMPDYGGIELAIIG